MTLDWKVEIMIVDTHAHLDFPELSQDLESVLDRAAQTGVQEIVTIGIDPRSSEKAVLLASRYPQVYATVGIHPHGAHHLDEDTLATLGSLARRERVVAIGEIGLDYYRNRQPRPIQQECLRQQLELACTLNLPAVLHIREAYEDFLGIITDYLSNLSGVVLHCFSGDWNVARRCLDMGFYLSIPGTITFPKAEMQQEVVRRAPLDRLLLETDSPYLAPVPHRGKSNEPSFVFYTAGKIAELRRTSLEEISLQTTANAHTIFRICDEKN